MIFYILYSDILTNYFLFQLYSSIWVLLGGCWLKMLAENGIREEACILDRAFNLMHFLSSKHTEKRSFCKFLRRSTKTLVLCKTLDGYSRALYVCIDLLIFILMPSLFKQSHQWNFFYSDCNPHFKYLNVYITCGQAFFYMVSLKK